LFLLSARPFALPFESKSCMVQVFTSRVYDENLRLRIVNSGLTHDILAERLIPIDKAYEVINAGGHSSQIVHSTDGEDLQSLSTLLINMFKEADEDGSGSLTFDEFQALMEHVELGISSQELRFVISEADENENGVVDYEEFVPLAVDLIQSFRARNRAKALNSHEDVLVDDVIYQSISQEELQTAADMCLERVYEIDTKRYGLIRVPELKKALNSVAANAGVRENEISLLCQMLPRDQFGRVKYNSTPTAFFDALSKVRFMTMKNAMIESQGSGLQKYLLELCKEEEMKNENYQGPKEKFVPNGVMSCRSLISILSNSSRLSLSRLQVLVIMSEASVLDGMINYFQFVPIVAKAIEIMFEPKALRQRAELIEKTDLSPEALLQGMTSDMFEQRLLTLFKSYDIDHNGMLDQSEFVACLESLDLQLSYGEMVALMAAADTAQHGFLKFEEFVGFFTHNLLNLEREKRLRLLQSSMHANKILQNQNSSGNHKQDNELDLITRLTDLFQLYDPNRSGFICFDDFESILNNFSLHSSKFLMDLMISELQVNDDGLVEYNKSLRLCGDLLKVFKAKESALEEHKQREVEAEAKALKFAQISVEETNRIVKFLRQRVKEIGETGMDANARYQEIQAVIRSPLSGLSKSEANMIISKLFMGIARTSSARGGLNQRVGSPSSPASSSALATSKNSPEANHLSSKNSPVNPEKRGVSRAKSINWTFTGQELFDAVFEARKTTIMRTLLRDDVDTTSAKQLILSALTKELERRRKRGEIPSEVSFLPLQACCDVLDNLRQFRLTRAQIMFILSCADCYDRDGAALDVYRFADHAASLVSNMNTVEILETRAEVINSSGIDDRKVLHGMQEKELLRLLEYSFQKITDTQPEATRHQVSREKLTQVLKELTRLRLSDREITTILVNLTMPIRSNVHSSKPKGAKDLDERFPQRTVSCDSCDSLDDSHDDDPMRLTSEPSRLLPEFYEWREVLPLIVESIRTLNRETMINRRVSLAATSMALKNRSGNSVCSQETKKLQEESLRQLTDLADKLLNYVKLQSQAERLTIALPMDGSARRSSQLTAETHMKMQNQEIITLFRGALFVPVTVRRSAASLSPALTTQHVPFGSPPLVGRKHSEISIPAVETHTRRQAIFIQLDAIEDTQMFSGCSLYLHAVSVNAKIHINEQLVVRLSSLGIVDREAAQQFAANFVEKIVFEQDVNDDSPKPIFLE
jgi:Ca2+-binding EF-hand superfamily protein